MSGKAADWLTQPVSVILFLLVSCLGLMVLGSLNGPSAADNLAAAGAMGYRSESEFGSLALRPPGADTQGYRVRKRAPEFPGGMKARQLSRQVAAACAYDFSEFPQRWQCLGDSLREELLRRTQHETGWREVVVHASGLAAEDPRYLVALHEAVLGIEGDMAYHFLIGGEQGDDKQVRLSARWELPAEQSFEGGRIHVCLAGDFDRRVPSAAQLRALHELVVLLRARVGEIPVSLHGGTDGCLGRMFPAAAVVEGMNRGVSPVSRGGSDKLALR